MFGLQRENNAQTAAGAIICLNYQPLKVTNFHKVTTFHAYVATGAYNQMESEMSRCIYIPAASTMFNAGAGFLEAFTVSYLKN